MILSFLSGFRSAFAASNELICISVAADLLKFIQSTLVGSVIKEMLSSAVGLKTLNVCKSLVTELDKFGRDHIVKAVAVICCLLEKELCLISRSQSRPGV